ncbi:MAG: LemA family protein [Elusimicrobia bacterium]|nr:LemA family protein [Elusimicrobiota bacterium]
MVLVIGIIAIAVVVVVASCAITIYNGLVLLKNNIDKAWANIDVLLKQRHDELPKLIASCEGYMSHERGVLDRVLKARQALMMASGPRQKGVAEGQLEGALRQLFAIAENYPDLKAQSSFQQLQNRISSLESDIADRREFYNESANNYNIRIASIPDMILAGWMKLSPREMFKVDSGDREDVKVEFRQA